MLNYKVSVKYSLKIPTHSKKKLTGYIILHLMSLPSNASPASLLADWSVGVSTNNSVHEQFL